MSVLFSYFVSSSRALIKHLLFLLFLPFQPLPLWPFLLLSLSHFYSFGYFLSFLNAPIKFPFESILPLAACNLVFICEMIWSPFFYFFHEFNQLSFHFFLWFCLFLFLVIVCLFLLLCFLPREVPLTFVVKLVQWCWFNVNFVRCHFLSLTWKYIFVL